jgi:hypothetical protein
MQVPRFRWLILISLGIHTILLWLYVSVLPFRPKPFSPRAPEYAEVDLRIIPSLAGPHTSEPEKKAPAPRPSTAPLRGPSRAAPSSPSSKTDLPSSPGEPSSREIRTPPAPGGTSPATGAIAPGSEGMAIGSGGSPSGTGDAPSAAGEAPTGPKGGASGSGGAATGTKGGSPGPGGTSTGAKGSSSASEIDHFSGVEIPSYVIDAAGFRSSHNDGAIYPEIDSYVFYAIDKQIGISVPGTEVCIEGDQLHTKERMLITEIKTDHSRCRSVESGEDAPPKVICPPEAQIRVVHFNHYASSPLVYSVRTCLEYDRSHCYIAGAGGEGEREVCRINFQYQGIWAEGTIFDYKCTKSEVRTHRHPLRYQIRWIMEAHIPGTDSSLAKRQIYQETRTVEPCN